MKTVKVQKSIRHIHYVPKFKMFKASGKYPRNLLIGYENEVEARNYASDPWKSRLLRVVNSNDFLYAKYDDSLNYGCEINTHPFNYNWFLKHNINQYFDAIADIGMRGTRNCGFHIHLSKSYFSSAHIAKMVKFFYTNKDFIRNVSQRKRTVGCYSRVNIERSIRSAREGNWNRQGCPNKNVDLRKWQGCREAADVLSDGDNDEKFVALNLLHDKTLEVRIFQGTINKKLVHAYIEFCLAATLYTQKEPFKRISVNGFKRYVKRNRSKYPYLIESNILGKKARKEYHWCRAA